MKSKIIKICMGATLALASATVLAAGTNCCESIECCLKMLGCC